jgi:hypothetical protein
MPVTVRNTDILFNDGTTQSTAAGAPTTAQILNATAGASAGAVGTYADLKFNSVVAAMFGTTAAGSNLRYSSGNGGSTQGTPAGTWRLMGSIDSYFGSPASVWLRIS